jgi:hypothetical protein
MTSCLYLIAHKVFNFTFIYTPLIFFQFQKLYGSLILFINFNFLIHTGMVFFVIIQQNIFNYDLLMNQPYKF